jgi:hypothetical protein
MVFRTTTAASILDAPRENIERLADLSAREKSMDDMQKEIVELFSEEPTDLRRKTLKTSLGFKSAWLLLAEHLRDVEQSKSFKDWGFGTFTAYCQDELVLNRSVARKLIRGLQWLEDEAPEYKPSADSRSPKTNLPKPVPDFDTVNVLARGLRESEEKRVPYEKYQEIRAAALEGASLNQVRKDLRDAVPEDIRKLEDDPVRHIKRALSEVEKALTRWSQDAPSDDATVKAARVRDGLFELVSTFEGSEDE